MIIDQLPEISSVQTTDEMPVERGQTTYKTPISKIFASPTLTGTPKAPTAGASTNNTQIATTAFANRAANNAVSTFVRPNLLDNWYFVGGGSQQGYGVFPINQRGQASYANNGYSIDRWRIDSNSSLTASSDCITFSSGQVTGYQSIRQWFSQDLPAGTYTLSLLAEITSIGGTVFFGLRDSGNLIKNNIRLSSGSGYRLFTLTFTLDSTVHGWSTSITTDNASSNYVTANIKAWKLEIGSSQTLAHQENGAWVLNEVPDYETELLRCKTSTADTSDTYANGSVEFGNNIGIVQNTNTATQNISKGQYVIWHGALYTASAAIASGDTLSDSNLTAVTGGGLNALAYFKPGQRYTIGFFGCAFVTDGGKSLTVNITTGKSLLRNPTVESFKLAARGVSGYIDIFNHYTVEAIGNTDFTVSLTSGPGFFSVKLLKNTELTNVPNNTPATANGTITILA